MSDGIPTGCASPLITIGNVVRSLDGAIAQHNLGSLSTYYELIAFEFVIVASIDLIRCGLAPEAVYVLSGLLISVASGSLWGLPRFTLVLFSRVSHRATVSLTATTLCQHNNDQHDGTDVFAY